MAITRLTTATKAASIILAVAICLLFVMDTSRPSYACTCVARTQEEYFNDAAAVFVGKVVDLDRLKGEYEVTFNVSQYWKGLSENDRFVAVQLHSMDTGLCGYPVQEGEEYLVYASRSNDQLAIGACEGTGRLTGEYDPVAILGTGIIPKDSDPILRDAAVVEYTIDPASALFIAAIVGLSVAMAVLIIRKPKR